MSDPLSRLLQVDRRYRREAYVFVRQALAYAQTVLGMGEHKDTVEEAAGEPQHHLTGQQLCEAIRQFALDQFGLLAKVVLNTWGLRTTGDFGEIVYNLIAIGEMKKSKSDRREDFDDVYNFDEAFLRGYNLGIEKTGKRAGR